MIDCNCMVVKLAVTKSTGRFLVISEKFCIIIGFKVRKQAPGG